VPNFVGVATPQTPQRTCSVRFMAFMYFKCILSCILLLIQCKMGQSRPMCRLYAEKTAHGLLCCVQENYITRLTDTRASLWYKTTWTSFAGIRDNKSAARIICSAVV